ncbi:hypothetical protein EM595_p0200 (plasmid) [Duffyella gerundensis]|uniref:Uncharacterized protein n=1 Tax=Duffyella gerundensis TaxID=1619313 RepID=A0A0U5LTZ0_9GAMM|nr:hypothetical protein EM595_p0200 [Duffyella gerundensis]
MMSILFTQASIRRAAAVNDLFFSVAFAPFYRR